MLTLFNLGNYAWFNNPINLTDVIVTEYNGMWKNGMRDGIGNITYSNNDTYSGEWLKDKFYGVGIFKKFNKCTIKSHWKDGFPMGDSVIEFYNGNKYNGYWNGKDQKGKGLFTWKDKTNFVGDWKMNTKFLTDAEGVITWHSGDSYSGSIVNNLLHGKGIYTWNTNHVYKGNWNSNKRDGIGYFSNNLKDIDVLLKLTEDN